MFPKIIHYQTMENSVEHFPQQPQSSAEHFLQQYSLSTAPEFYRAFYPAAINVAGEFRAFSSTAAIINSSKLLHSIFLNSSRLLESIFLNSIHYQQRQISAEHFLQQPYKPLENSAKKFPNIIHYQPLKNSAERVLQQYSSPTARYTVAIIYSSSIFLLFLGQCHRSVD
jgi:hypothetical protein